MGFHIRRSCLKMSIVDIWNIGGCEDSLRFISKRLSFDIIDEE